MEDKNTVVCLPCGGSGKEYDHGQSYPCPDCNGTGSIPDHERWEELAITACAALRDLSEIEDAFQSKQQWQAVQECLSELGY